MNYYRIHIDGKQFEQQYLVYIVRLRHSSDTVRYYVGQTGDRHYRTARPAFRRLAAHFEDRGYSTQNQVYRAVAGMLHKKEFKSRTRFSNDVKHEVSKYLVESQIDMFVFPIRPFDREVSSDQHKENVRFIEGVEQCTIWALCERHGKDAVLNKRISAPRDMPETKDIAGDIIAAFASADQGDN